MAMDRKEGRANISFGTVAFGPIMGSISPQMPWRINEKLLRFLFPYDSGHLWM